MDQEIAINTAKVYAEVVKEELSPEAIIIFGSYVNGTPNEDSDIDVGVIFNNFKGDYLKARQKLWRLRRDVSYDIEPHLLDSAKDPSGFTQHVMSTGKIVFRNDIVN